jgi:predicted DCC family thiol-disulfide oxidoreductase YuxK
MPSENGPILFFDGVCNLCNAAVRFVIRQDRSARLRFASLQSAAGQAAQAAVRERLGRVPDSLILLENGRYHTESAAALRLASRLDGGWKLLGWLRILPAFLRDPLYRLIARRRYRWFGRSEACLIPSPALKARFLPD